MELRDALSKALRTQDQSSVISDQALVQACLSGDEQAWSILIERYKRLIYSIPVKQRLQPCDAADIFQSVCLELVESLPNLRDTSKLKSWLITITLRKCFHWCQERRRNVALASEKEAEAAPDDSADFARFTLEVEREQAIRDAFEKLPPRCAVLLRHLFFEEQKLPYSRIAERIGVSANTVGSTRERCLERLRVILAEMGVALD